MQKNRTYKSFNKFFLLVIATLSVVVFLGLRINEHKDKYGKLKILTKVLRLLDEQYVEEGL